MGSIRIVPTKKVMETGQALTELAIFGSILLLCVATLLQYGLEANYQQQVQMEAFRKAQKIAFYRSGPNASTSLVLVKDKAYPDPRDQFGFPERYPVAASENVVWDVNQNAQYVKKFPDVGVPADQMPKEKDLPALYFDIEKGDLTKLNQAIPSGQRPSLPSEAGQKNAFGFYTAKFDKIACPDNITVIFEDPTPAHNALGNTGHTQYFTVQVAKGAIRVARIQGDFGNTKTDPDYQLLMHPYYEYIGNGLKYLITEADVDGDGEMETIIGADKYKNLFYVDYHDAYLNGSLQPSGLGGAIQIDSSNMQVEAGDKVKFWNGEKWILGGNLQPKDRQGMLQDFDKTAHHTDSKIVKKEEKGVITSQQTTLNAKQRFIHKFRLNGGTIVEIPVEVSTDPSKALYDWSVK